MRRIGDAYVLAGLVWLVLGMVFGIWMGVAQKLGFANTHAHIALAGFAVSAIFGLIHRQYPSLADSGLAGPQFWLYQGGAVVLLSGKAMVDGGGSDMLVKVGSLVVVVATLGFLWMFATRSGD